MPHHQPSTTRSQGRKEAEDIQQRGFMKQQVTHEITWIIYSLVTLYHFAWSPECQEV